MAQYHSLSKELQERILEDREKHKKNPYAFPDEKIVRRRMDHDKANLWRPAFVRDVEKIMHVPYYNRYSDKTQVFSFYQNDDISRRACMFSSCHASQEISAVCWDSMKV